MYGRFMGNFPAQIFHALQRMPTSRPLLVCPGELRSGCVSSWILEALFMPNSRNLVEFVKWIASVVEANFGNSRVLSRVCQLFWPERIVMLPRLYKALELGYIRDLDRPSD